MADAAEDAATVLNANLVGVIEVTAEFRGAQADAAGTDGVEG
jgi:hypothetical protein